MKYFNIRLIAWLIFCLIFGVCQGYFARWAALRKLLNQFLDGGSNADENGHSKKQILSLGAGFDTTYFQLQVSKSPSQVPSSLCLAEYKSCISLICFLWMYIFRMLTIALNNHLAGWGESTVLICGTWFQGGENYIALLLTVGFSMLSLLFMGLVSADYYLRLTSQEGIITELMLNDPSCWTMRKLSTLDSTRCPINLIAN